MLLQFVLATLASGPNFQLSFEFQSVKISAQEDMVYHRFTEREESDPAAGASRLTIVGDDGTVVMTMTKTELDVVRTEPDGTRQTESVPLGTESQWKKAAYAMMGPMADEIFKLAKSTTKAHIEVTKETKTIAGVLCQKSVTTESTEGQPTEFVTWNCIDRRYKDWTLPSLETYLYAVDGTTRKLLSAETVTSATFGATKPTLGR
ncbi:MAG TPA: hypothetical protein VMI31_16260 [Fimbriimonadaceae bacterium]|nr:hypothetical protein [Fimbriimonadaceae bacterium]